VSVPARQAAVPAPELRPAERRAGPRPSVARAPAPARAPRRDPGPRRRPRRRVHAGYLVFTGVVVSALIVGVVALNALLAQAAFGTRAAQARLDVLRSEQVRLIDEAARSSSPVVVATWARRHGMVTPRPGEVHVLRVPGTGR
jgi:hypothetical protein